jgi:hypothetical protein
MIYECLDYERGSTLLHFLLADYVVYNKIINQLSSELATSSIASVIDERMEEEEEGRELLIANYI